jgi:hypothetical protein
LSDSLRRALRDPKREDAKEMARALDEKVMRPVRALMGASSRVLLSPDSTLNLVPFAALPRIHAEDADINSNKQAVGVRPSSDPRSSA